MLITTVNGSAVCSHDHLSFKGAKCGLDLSVPLCVKG